MTKAPTATAKKATAAQVTDTTDDTDEFMGTVIQEIPAGLGRANNTQKLPFPWDKYAAANENRKVDVPATFWSDKRGYQPSDITAKKCRERLQRAFYAWKNPADEAVKKSRANFSLGFADQFSGKGEDRKYTGTHMYFQVKKPAK